ncbi:hypothetical protein ACIA8K_01950 [Catenuloplanes sp. NPDC051500]|uniref:hypothetical protein n=1 Tax=Catenuloplanes sp. NPDC051500 TaxID=3363959 RepID=UPI0037BAE540
MQPEIPYRVIGKLGSCDVGTVWSAVDEARGLPVTVAVMDPRAASDQRWRDAFAGHAGAINGAAPTWVGADFAAPAPWVAFNGTEQPGAERVFISLGRPYTPTGPPERDAATQPMSPISGPPNQPVSGMPISGMPISGMPVSGGPASRQPVSGMPANMGLENSPRRPYFGEGAEDPYGSSVGGNRGVPKLWIGVAAVVAVLLIGAGVIFGITRSGGDKPVATGPTGTAPASPSPSAAPIRPGLEPPRIGDWPTWPSYTDKDPVRPFALDGLPFEVTLPVNWECTSNPNAVQFTCGYFENGAMQAGGDIILRECASPCDENRRTQLRATEDAFGAQWRFAGDNVTIAELEGEVYGLAMIGYFRSTELGPIDRQLVLHMSGPSPWANEFRKISNNVHDTTGL